MSLCKTPLSHQKQFSFKIISQIFIRWNYPYPKWKPLQGFLCITDPDYNFTVHLVEPVFACWSSFLKYL